MVDLVCMVNVTVADEVVPIHLILKGEVIKVTTRVLMDLEQEMITEISVLVDVIVTIMKVLKKKKIFEIFSLIIFVCP